MNNKNRKSIEFCILTFFIIVFSFYLSGCGGGGGSSSESLPTPPDEPISSLETCNGYDDDGDGSVDEENVCKVNVYVCRTFMFDKDNRKCLDGEWTSGETNIREIKIDYSTFSGDKGLNSFFTYVCDAYFEDGDYGCYIFTRGDFFVVNTMNCNNNGVAEEGEECDGSDLKGKSCNDFGYNGGSFKCNKCFFDLSSCNMDSPSEGCDSESPDVNDGLDNNCNGYVDEGFSTTSPNIFTSIEASGEKIVEIGLEIMVDDFPSFAPKEALYFWALSVDFVDFPSKNIFNTWGHIGLQHARTCSSDHSRCANWGGGGSLDTGDYGKSGINIISYPWEEGRWYRYIIRKNGSDDEGWIWEGLIVDDKGAVTSVGTISGGEYIALNHHGKQNPMIMTETGYGVVCDSPASRVRWRDPYIIGEDGINIEITKLLAFASFDSCNKLNQKVISITPIEFTHEYNIESGSFKNYEVIYLRDIKDF